MIAAATPFREMFRFDHRKALLLPSPKEVPIHADDAVERDEKTLMCEIGDWRASMGGGTVLPAGDILLLTGPILGILALAMFGLDELYARPKRSPQARRFFCEVDGKGSASLCDPDGTPWRKASIRQFEGKLIPMGGEGREQPAAAPMWRAAVPGSR